ncbi:MAG: hypothetical protein WC076_09900, partial [Terrimicrobiaceae bacterium]
TRFQFLENHGSRFLAEPFLPISNFTFFVHPTTTLSPQRVLFSLFYFCQAQSCPSQVNGNASGELLKVVFSDLTSGLLQCLIGLPFYAPVGQH